MEITRKRDVTLIELLPMFWDNKFDYLVFQSHQGGFITFDKDKTIAQAYGISPSDTFTIKENVKVDQEVRLNLIVIYKDGSAIEFHDRSIVGVRVDGKIKHSNIKFIYLQNDDGSIGELIWDKERGLVD